MSRKKPIALVINLVLISCKSTAVSPPTLPPTTSTPNENPQSTRGEWFLTPSYTAHSYRSVTRSFIRQTSTLSSHQDTVEQTLRFTITLDPTGTQSTISGRVDSVIVEHHSQNLLLPSDERFPLPLIFTGAVNPTELKLEAKNPRILQNSCNSQVDEILSDVRVGIVTYPIHLNSGLRWKDSTLTTVCIGNGIPTTTRIVSFYEVLGEITYDREQAILIQRLDSIHISGEGAQESHQIQLNGSGAGTAKIYINSSSGVALATEISQALDIAVTSSATTHHFRQQISQNIQRVN